MSSLGSRNDTRPQPEKPKPVEVFYFKDGTSYELWKSLHYGSSSTVYVSENGWRTTNWWSSFEMAKADYDSQKQVAEEKGTIKK